VIFGKHGHAEVIGLQGQTNNEALVFQDIAELDNADLPQNLPCTAKPPKAPRNFIILKMNCWRGYEVKGQRYHLPPGIKPG
jgi:4-hydroxy-3-methylbut-2-enyl diphosphate reductase